MHARMWEEHVYFLKIHFIEVWLIYSAIVPTIGEGDGTPLQTLAWKIPWTEEPGSLQSMGLRRVGHDWATSLSLFTLMHWRRKWQPTPVFSPGESQGRGAWWAAVYGVAQSWTWQKWLSSSSSYHTAKWVSQACSFSHPFPFWFATGYWA